MSSSSSLEEDLTPILQQLTTFHSKWVALNDRCKALQSSLNEANGKNEELEIMLARCLEQSSKKEEENKKLTGIVRKLQKKLQTGSVNKLMNALKQNIRAYDEAILPSISELTKDVTMNDNSDVSNSEDENDLGLSALITIDIAPKPVNSNEGQIQDPQSKAVIEQNCPNEMVMEKSPILFPLMSSSGKNSSVYIALVPPCVQNIEDITIDDASCGSEISSSGVAMPSAERRNFSQAIVIAKNSSCANKCISSTSSSRSDNKFIANDSENGSLAVTQTNMKLKSLEDVVQPCLVNTSNMESLHVVGELIAENFPHSSMNTNLSDEVSLNVNKSLLKETVVTEDIKNRINCVQKPDVLLCLPSTVVPEISKDNNISCKIIGVETSDLEKNQSERLKRPCTSPSSIFESSSKRSAIDKSSSSCSKSPRWLSGNEETNHLKCLICEYEDIDNDKTFETYLVLDDHIIEKHPNPFPPYVRCMFNNEQCKRHFHPKQNFHKHVKRAHSLDDPVLISETNHRKPFKCTTCSKLFLFQSDFKEHSKQVHRTTPNKKKLLQKLCHQKSAEHSQSTWVRSVAECEVCKKDNRPSVKYRLYDELDAHISKCHSDPFPDYFRCPYCKRHFKNVKWLTSHIMKKHPDNYSKSPLEKFLPFETPEEGSEQMTSRITNTPEDSPESAVTDCPLRILSPSTINKAISTAITSFSVSKSKLN